MLTALMIQKVRDGTVIRTDRVPRERVWRMTEEPHNNLIILQRHTLATALRVMSISLYSNHTSVDLSSDPGVVPESEIHMAGTFEFNCRRASFPTTSLPQQRKELSCGRGGSAWCMEYSSYLTLRVGVRIFVLTHLHVYGEVASRALQRHKHESVHCVSAIYVASRVTVRHTSMPSIDIKAIAQSHAH